MKHLSIAALILIATGVCAAQEELTVQAKGKQSWSAEEVQTIYRSSCAAVQREFGVTHAPSPRLTLVLGANKNELAYIDREIRLQKWDGFLFAQGVVALAFEEIMTADERMKIARRAVGWANATVKVTQLGP